MLIEQVIAAVGAPTKPLLNTGAKDAGIFVHEYQPLLAQQQVFKNSATPPNCLAVSSSHIFAAQAGKAVVHAYSREKGNQEATVPFTERITCLALACDETQLILGTAEGRIFLWELGSGRQVSTAQAHLQAVTVLAVDPTQNFLLSASKDSTVHVWSIPALLSFSNTLAVPLSPVRTFTSHRAEITAMVLGHSSSFCNIAVSASKDKTCFIWDFHTNTVLRTYLLPSVPTCFALDAADRVLYVGYEDGSVQHLDLYSSENGKISTVKLTQTPAPIQPPSSSRRQPSNSSTGATLSFTVSFDGCTVLSGHESGTILVWDVAKRSPPTGLLQSPLPGPVTNLSFLSVTGFLNERRRNLKVPAVVKPKFGAFDSSTGTVPSNYILNVELPSNLPTTEPSEFEQALMGPSFSTALLDEGLSELLCWNNHTLATNGTTREEDADFMALDGEADQPKQLSLAEQNTALKSELEALRRLQAASFDKIEKICSEKRVLLDREHKRSIRANGTNIGTGDSELDIDYSSSSEG